jgi:hypothetical protein
MGNPHSCQAAGMIPQVSTVVNRGQYFDLMSAALILKPQIGRNTLI